MSMASTLYRQAMKLTIRQMTTFDIPLGMRLKSQAGWNQLPGDWQRLIEMEPTGCFVAQLNEQDVGTLTTTVFGDIAWIAMMLVDENFRGQGIGKALMNHALAYLDHHKVRSVRLDATPQGQPLYEKLGFEAQFEIARYAGTPAAGEITPAHPVDLDKIIALDQEVTCTQRARLLRKLFNEFPSEVRTWENGSYITARPGETAVQIGPCIADSSCGQQLLQDALARHAGQLVFVDVPAVHTIANLSPQRSLMRMTRGKIIQEDTSRLWASSGPEKG